MKNAMMKALQEVVGKAGANMSEASKNSILALIGDDASDKTGKTSESLWSACSYTDIENRWCFHDQCQTPGCIGQGPSPGYCRPTYQVSSSRWMVSVLLLIFPPGAGS